MDFNILNQINESFSIFNSIPDGILISATLEGGVSGLGISVTMSKTMSLGQMPPVKRVSKFLI